MIPAPSIQSNTSPEDRSGHIQLCAKGLRMAFGGQVILDGVDLELRQGEVVLLRGENGSGKTTLLNILTGNLEPDAGEIQYLADGSPRTYRFPRRWWQELNPWDHFRPEFVAQEGIGRTWQDVRLFGAQSLRDNIAVAEPGHPGENPLIALIAPDRSDKRETEINREADAILARFGLGGRENSSGNKVSIGQSKRVAIARAVEAGARVLFLDEPLAGLDRQGIDEVLSLLKALVVEKALTLVIVEHVFNQPHLQGIVTKDWFLENGLIRKKPIVVQEPEVSPRITTPSSINPAGRLPDPCWFSLLADGGAEICSESLPRGALLTRIRRPERFHFPVKPVLEIHDFVVKRGPRTVIGLDDDGNSTGFDLTIYEGEIAILQAPNGWGKSTLFAALLGLIQAHSGSVVCNGESFGELLTWDRVRRGLRALSSGLNTFSGLSVEENLYLAGNAQKPIGFRPLSSRICSSLSGGERQRVALGSIQRGILGIFDEPFHALDKDGAVRALGDLLKVSCSALILEPKHIM